LPIELDSAFVFSKVARAAASRCCQTQRINDEPSAANSLLMYRELRLLAEATVLADSDSSEMLSRM
jgi:hypothetical protein